jgi:hypothetical protein
MPEFYIKKGLADVELKNWIELNKDEPFVRVDIEVESTHERLRRSFHALIREWFKSGEYSANGADIRSYEKLRNYYKLLGCDNKPAFYIYKNNYYKSREDLKNNIDDDFNIKYVTVEPRHWEDMTRKQKSLALDGLLTEIKMSMSNNNKVMEWVYKITSDIEMLNSIGYKETK